MRSPWRAAIIAFCVCALGAITPLYAQSGVREARSPLREPYQPTLGSNVARSGSQPAGAVRVAIVGAIAAPGTYQASGGIALPDLFRAAGGMIDQATDNLLLIRGGRIHGPFLLQNGTVATPGELSLIDGDVVVVRARRGVRTLLYQTLAPGADGVPMRSSVDNAARMDFVYVACLGLTDYPVVLPLNPQQATTDTLLLNLLGMSPETVATAVKRVGEAATPLDQRMLTDGTVLLIDPRQVPPGGLRPVEPFPPPRPIPDQSTEQTSPEEVAPGAYDPEPVTGASIDASLRPVSGGYRLTDPLPGFQPFVVEDRPSDQNFSPPEPDVHVQRPIQVDRGHDPVDVTTRRGPRPQLTPPSLSSGSQFSSDRQRSEAALSQVAMQAIREAPPAVPVESPLAFSDASEEDSTLSTAAPQVAVGGRIDLTVILGTAVAAVLCLLASYLWAREERRRRQQDSAGNAAPAQRSFTADDGVDHGAELAALLNNQLPLVEEPPQFQLPGRLHGPVVGQRKVMFDAAHPHAAAPHFTLGAAAGIRRQEERAARHLAAAVAATKSPHAPVAPESATPRHPAEETSQGAHRSLRFDVVEPEESASLHPHRSETSAVRPVSRARSGELLTRVLQSLREEESR